MAEPPVVDASPLIILSKAERTDLLLVAGEVVLVPEVVQREIEAFGEDDTTVRTVRALPWLRFVDTPPIPDAIERYQLDPGESAVLAWALAHPGTAVIVDDGPARWCASELGIPVVGR